MRRPSTAGPSARRLPAGPGRGAHVVPPRMQRRAQRRRWATVSTGADEGHELAPSHDRRSSPAAARRRRSPPRPATSGGAPARLAQHARMQHVGPHACRGRRPPRTALPAGRPRGRLLADDRSRCGLRRRLPVARARSIRRARTSSSPGRSPCRPTRNWPSRTDSSSRLQFSLCAAGSSARARTSAQTSRTEAPDISIDMLPSVIPSSGAFVGVAGQHRDALEPHVQLVGGDLGQRGDDALADLDLADGEPHGAVGLEGDPLVQPRIVVQARGRQCGSCRASLRRARRSTARMMRGWAPQRQRLPSSAAAISARRRRRRCDPAAPWRRSGCPKAVAALACLLIEERLLQRMRMRRRAQPLDRGHRYARRRCRPRASTRGSAHHRAAPCSCRTAPAHSRSGCP